jgi:adenine-specific DNA-methyltransferase
LRDRLTVARDLLTESGSIFVQIGEENLHRVRMLLDEIFGDENFVIQINYRNKNPLGQSGLASVFDYILHYAKSKSNNKYRGLFTERVLEDEPEFRFLNEAGGVYKGLSKPEIAVLPKDVRSRVFRRSVLVSSGYTQSCTYELSFQGRNYWPITGRSWRTHRDGMERLIKAQRLMLLGSPQYRQFYSDFALMQYQNVWVDTAAGDLKTYVVQTLENIVQRCILMATDPGDLVLDPTCGSGTTAYVAEQHGRHLAGRTCSGSRACNGGTLFVLSAGRLS